MGHLGWLYKLNLHPRYQHCTDEAQKAETVLSAVIYIYIYIYISLTNKTSEGLRSHYLDVQKQTSITTILDHSHMQKIAQFGNIYSNRHHRFLLGRYLSTLMFVPFFTCLNKILLRHDFLVNTIKTYTRL